MKKILIVFMALVCTATLMAQRIAVVDASGSTQIFKTLQEAIEGAADGSVIYLPGGGFPVDNLAITKKLTIIGIGHKSNNDNVDGSTVITGDLYFWEGSSGSAVMGCYITKGIWIGSWNNVKKEVNDVLIRNCNVNLIRVCNNLCKGTLINQNYIRETAEFEGASARFTNNVVQRVKQLDNGFIDNNIITSGYSDYKSIDYCHGTSIKNNIFIKNHIFRGEDCQIENNMVPNSDDWYNSINIPSPNWSDIFVNFNNGSISPTSDFHFKGEYTQYQGMVGIYAGTGFSDDQLPPVPYIVSKSIAEQTDASGNLKVRIRVKAGGQE